VAGLGAFRVLGPRLFGKSTEIKPTFVAQEECKEGKLVDVREGSRVVASYRCSEEDAAIAVVSVDDRNNEDRIGWFPSGEPTDANGNEYVVLAHPVGHFLFFTLLRSYGVAPKSVIAKGRFAVFHPHSAPDPNPSNLPQGKEYSVSFTKLAAPKRILTPPTGNALIEAEKSAVAKYDPGTNTIQLEFPTKQHPTASVMATSFCPDGAFRMLQPPRNTVFRDADAVKIRFQDWRSRQSTPWTVSYRNAKIVTKNGRRQLVFPSSQDIGTVEDGQAHIEMETDRAISFKPAKRQISDVHISINGGTKNFIERPKLTLLSMTPSVEEMGLDAINLLVEKYAFNQQVLAKPNFKGHLATTIPQLTFRFQLTHTERVGSQDIILPVHHPEKK
jgi:hypothetical protein